MYLQEETEYRSEVFRFTSVCHTVKNEGPFIPHHRLKIETLLWHIASRPRPSTVDLGLCIRDGKEPDTSIKVKAQKRKFPN